MKRIFEDSCMSTLRRYVSPVDAPGFEHDDGLGAEQAVLRAAQGEDVDADVGSSARASGTPSAAAAFASREPSMWTVRPSPCAWSTTARISSTE